MPPGGRAARAQFRETGRPVGARTRLDLGLQVIPECRGTRREELRSVVELKRSRTSRGHSAADAPRFFKYHDVVGLRELTRDDQPGQPGANYPDRCDSFTLRETVPVYDSPEEIGG